MTQEDEEDFENSNIFRFFEKNIESDKVRNQCHSTGAYRGPTHNKCIFKVKQSQGKFIPFKFHNFSNYDCHLFFKTLVVKKIIK